MTPRTHSPLRQVTSGPGRALRPRMRRALPARLGALALLGAVALGGAACSSGGGSAPATSSVTVISTSPPTGSGASATGITATTPPAIVPQGATKVNAACRQMYPAMNDSMTAWNTAVSADDAAGMKKAAEAMDKAAAGMPAVAKASDDATLIKLTDAVVAQVKTVVTAQAADKDIDATGAAKAASDLWAHCQKSQ